MDQIFFGVNLLNVSYILLTYVLQHYYLVSQFTVFGMQYAKELILTIIVIWGAARADPTVDKSIKY